MTAKQVLAVLREVAHEDKAAFLPGFVKVVPGGKARHGSTRIFTDANILA